MTEFERLRINAGINIVQLTYEADVSRGTLEKIEREKPVKAVLAACASMPLAITCQVLSLTKVSELKLSDRKWQMNDLEKEHIVNVFAVCYNLAVQFCSGW